MLDESPVIMLRSCLLVSGIGLLKHGSLFDPRSCRGGLCHHRLNATAEDLTLCSAELLDQIEANVPGFSGLAKFEANVPQVPQLAL